MRSMNSDDLSTAKRLSPSRLQPSPPPVLISNPPSAVPVHFCTACHPEMWQAVGYAYHFYPDATVPHPKIPEHRSGVHDQGLRGRVRDHEGARGPRRDVLLHDGQELKWSTGSVGRCR